VAAIAKIRFPAFTKASEGQFDWRGGNRGDRMRWKWPLWTAFPGSWRGRRSSELAKAVGIPISIVVFILLLGVIDRPDGDLLHQLLAALERYQTLIAGILAASAGYLLWRATMMPLEAEREKQIAPARRVAVGLFDELMAIESTIKRIEPKVQHFMAGAQEIDKLPPLPIEEGFEKFEDRYKPMGRTAVPSHSFYRENMLSLEVLPLALVVWIPVFFRDWH
jgi:hypothetical protein